MFGARGFEDRLAELRGLSRLETLDLTNTQFAQGQVRWFFTTARLDNLRELVLRNSNFWEGEELAALADTPVAPRLRRLDVSGNRLSDAGARVLASRPEFGNLEVLTFRADELEPFSCVHGNGAAALANSTTLTRLKALDLSDHYVGDAGLRDLVNGPNAERLERLAVEYNEIGEIGDSGVTAVVESPRLANLRELVLCGNRLGRLEAEALAAWPHLERMRFVDLRECRAPIDRAENPADRRRTVGYGSAPLTDAVRAILRRSRWAEKFVL